MRDRTLSPELCGLSVCSPWKWKEERKLGAAGLASVTGNYGVLQVGEGPSDG